MMAGHCFGGASSATMELTVATDTADYNVYTEYTAAGGTGPGVVIVTINSGVACYCSSGAAGFRTGAMPAGSSVKLINHGTIAGKRGLGGVGGTSGSQDGGAGTAGKEAMHLDCDIVIDNTDGYIFGGGGGGGGGAWGRNLGGFGHDGGDGGDGKDWLHARGHGEAAPTGPPGGDGGDGGEWGAGGVRGQTYADGSRTVGGVGGAKGVAGYAVALNGHTATWLGGYDTTHVKGKVE